MTEVIVASAGYTGSVNYSELFIIGKPSYQKKWLYLDIVQSDKFNRRNYLFIYIFWLA